jgi:hypothetical protein
VRVFSINASDTVLFPVDIAAYRTCSPTLANFDTPASIRSITARCSRSQATKYT